MDLFGTAHSRIGQRDGNEDSYLVDNELELYIVSDGMGGAAGGELASRMAIDLVATHLATHAEALQRLRTVGDVDGAGALLSEAVVVACGAIYARALSDLGLQGMGATFTGMLRVGSKAVLAHVGDSRAYLSRDGVAHQVSQDHSFVGALLRAGVINEEQAAKHPHRNVITRALGLQPAVLVDTLVIDLIPGDRVVLCSDGFSGLLPSDDWLAKQVVADDPTIIAEALARFADHNGGKDNITVLVVAVGEFDPAIDSPEESEEAKLGLTYLRTVPAFRALPLSQLCRVLRACETRAVDAGTVVHASGSLAERLIIVLSGTLKVNSGDFEDRTLAAGQRSGLGALLRPRATEAEVVAVEDSLLLELSQDRFRSLTRRRPHLGVRLLHELSNSALEELAHGVSTF